MGEIAVRKPKSNSVHSRWIAVNYNDKGWQSVQWRYVGCEHKKGVNDGGLDAVSFWNMLRASSGKEGCYWVVGWGIYEIICRYGFYEGVVSGDILITRNQISHFKGAKAVSNSKLYGAMVCENPPTIIDCEINGGGMVKFLDLRNWGITTEMVVADGRNPTIDDVVQSIQDYVCLLRCLDMGQLKCTAASQGYYSFRRSCLKHELIADDASCSRSLERNSYYAGRAEAFRLGKLEGNIVHLDVSSMYTAFGFDQYFPIKLRRLVSMPSLTKIMEPCDHRQWIADVTIETDKPVFPLRIDKRVIYPVGEFRTVLPWPELCLALWNGCVKKVYLAAEYDCEQIFREWAEWYSHSLNRLEHLGLSHMRPALKLAVNSMYGKIGQRSKQWVNRDNDRPCYRFDQWWQRHPDVHNLVQWRAIDGCVQYLDAGIEPTISFPSISATMCSYGRVHLWNLMRIAGCGNTFYVDTDGIMVNDIGYSNLDNAFAIEPGTMGKLRIREMGESVTIFGIKHYLFNERYCCAGLPDRDVIRKHGIVEYSRHRPFDYSLWHKQGFVHKYDRITRTERPKYNHGVPRPDGRIDTFKVGRVNLQELEENNNGRPVETYSIMGSVNTSSWE